MAEVLTTYFKNDITRLFAADVANSDYYLFVSSIGRITSENSLFSTNQFLEKTLFGKKILNKDIHYMIRYYPWQRGQVFEQYDDSKVLEEVKFYAVVGPNDNDTGDYRVYKCLFNNYGATVQSPPNYNATTADQIYRTADGYVWKYMYVISELEFEAYNGLGFIPIIDPFTVNPASANGSPISDIVVENPNDNTGYVVAQGGLIGSPTPAPFFGLIVVPFTTFSPIQNFYAGQYIYLTNPNGTTNLYTITSYTWNANNSTAEIRTDGNPIADGVAGNASFKIFPKIEILGDGQGAKAIPEIVNGRIKSATLLQKGTGYRNVTASVVDPAFDFDPEDPSTTDVRAVVRAVLAPPGGHNYNLIDEFACKHVGFYAYITTEDNNQIGATNTYGIVGIVKNPLFANTASGTFGVYDANSSPTVFDNRIAIITDDIDRVTANSVVSQYDANNQVVFSGIVHEVDLTSNTMYIAEYMGPYRNGANVSINYLGTSLSSELPFRNETGQTIQINTPANTNIIVSPYIQRSGRVYYIRDFFPLPRNEASREEFKFVLEF